MEAEQFDRIAKQLRAETPRRTMLKAVAAAVGGGMLALRGRGSVAVGKARGNGHLGSGQPGPADQSPFCLLTCDKGLIRCCGGPTYPEIGGVLLCPTPTRYDACLPQYEACQAACSPISCEEQCLDLRDSERLLHDCVDPCRTK